MNALDSQHSSAGIRWISNALVGALVLTAGSMTHAQEPTAANTSDGEVTTFGGGVIVKDRVPVGDTKSFNDAGYEVISDGKGRSSVVVDETGNIYRDRNYHGIIPGIRDAFNLERFAKMSARHRVCWVGFQPKRNVSRVFWQLTHATPRYEVTKVDNQTVEVFFPGGRIDRRNNRRYLYTDKFAGPTTWIRGRNARKGATYRISLRADAQHTHRFEAPFLYVDFN